MIKRIHNKLSAELARETFTYDLLTGVLKWNSKSGKTRGKEAGTRMANGYLKVGINYQEYPVTAIIWLIVYGKFPDHEIDHVDGVGTHNWLTNLRDATKSQNAANIKKRRGKGVSYDGPRGKWRASIMQNYKAIHIGRFDSYQKARDAYDAKAKELFGEFAS